MSKSVLILLLSLSFAGQGVFAEKPEAQARDVLASIILRYREAKDITSSAAAEISLACDGEVLTDFVFAYFREIDSQHLNKTLINNYSEIDMLVQNHEKDAENVYAKIRSNLIEAIRQMLADQRSKNQGLVVPPMSVTDYGAASLQANFTLCNDGNFKTQVAQLAPLTASYDETVEGPTYAIPIGQNDGADYANAINGTPPKPQLTTVKKPIKGWLYDIQRR